MQGICSLPKPPVAAPAMRWLKDGSSNVNALEPTVSLASSAPLRDPVSYVMISGLACMFLCTDKTHDLSSRSLGSQWSPGSCGICAASRMLA